MNVSAKTQDNLWTLIAAPMVWGFHFLFSYFLAAYRCAPNADPFREIGGTRLAIGVATIVCLGLITLILWRAWREWRIKGGAFCSDTDAVEARERFLEFSTLLVAALSFAAIVFQTMPILLIGDCQ